MPKFIVTRTEKYSTVIVAPNLDQARDTLDAMSGDDWIVPYHADETLSEIPHMTDAQMDSIRIIHEWHSIEQPLGEFMATASPQIGWDDGSLMIEARGIHYGIEADGSRHT